jgi:multidrug resistance protein
LDSRLILVAATAFLYLLGLGVLFPVLPYFGRELGLSEFEVGLLAGSYALASVVTAPFWGRFSDRYGRRPALLLGLVGFSLAFGLFGLGTSFWQLLGARLLGGVLAAATQPAIMSYTVDITPPERRNVALGMVGAAFGLGALAGPVVGGLLSDFGYRVPFFATAGIGAFTALAVALFVRESLTPEIREETRRRRALLAGSGLGMRRIAAGLAPFLAFSLLVQTGRSGFESTIGFLVDDRLAGDAASVGFLLGGAGIAAVIVQGGALRGLARRYSDHQLMVAGTLLQVFGLLGLGFAPSWTWLVASALVLATGSALLTPTFTAALSRAAEDVQGEAQGLNASAQSLGRAAGPMIFTLLYQQTGTLVPYLGAALLTALGLVLALRGLVPSLVSPAALHSDE